VGLKYKLEDNYPEDSGGFVQFLQAISKIWLQITKRPIPFTFFWFKIR
jgi:hypothetical protein